MRNVPSLIKRLIKKMRVLDYLMVGGIIIIIGSFLFLRLSRKTQWTSVLVRVQPDQLWWEANPAPWYTQAISMDQEAYNSFGQKVAVINHVQSFETNDGRNEILTEVKLKTSYDSFRHQYEYNYQPVLIGKPLEIPFAKFSLSGMVIGINTQLTFVEKNIEARILAIHPWKITELAQGLQAKDMSGNVVAEIQDINIQNAQVYQFDDVYGRQIITRAEDATRRDVIMKLKIKTILYNGTPYSLDGAPIKIGSHFNLQFPLTMLSFLEISAIYD
jgi:hypothetical protein